MMMRNGRFPVLIAVVLAAGLAVASSSTGCRPKKQPTRTDTGAQQPPAVDPYAQMSELQRSAAELRQVAQRLPGRDAKDDRQLVVQAFDRAKQSLELLAGPTPPGTYRQQLLTIDSSQKRLRSAAGDLPLEPATDAGLRSVADALQTVRERLFPNNDAVQKQIDALQTRINELDTVRGPLHSLVVADAFRNAGTVIEAMANELQGRTQAAAGSPDPGIVAFPQGPAPGAPRAQ